MKELTTQTGIIVKCSKTAIEFFQNAQSVDFFSALEIPKEFQDIAVEFYDLIISYFIVRRNAANCHNLHRFSHTFHSLTKPISQLACIL